MNIWAIDAFQGFDWLHFLVKAKTQDEAKELVRKYFEWSTTEGVEEVLKTCKNDYPEIVAFRADKGEREYGQQDFTVEDIGDIGVQDYNSSGWNDFDTVEEAQKYIDEQLKKLGPGYCINSCGYDFNYTIENIEESNALRKQLKMKPLRVVTTILEDITPEPKQPRKPKGPTKSEVFKVIKEHYERIGGIDGNFEGKCPSNKIVIELHNLTQEEFDAIDKVLRGK